MTDRPILFSAPMVRALLSGKKTQTRRVLNPQPFTNGFHFDGRDILCHCDELPPATLMRRMGKGTNAYTGSILEDGPEGLTGMFVGDRLWVREAFSGPHDYEVEKWPPRAWFPNDPIWYWADGNPEDGDWTRPKPGIHMPRWASRLTLLVTEVRVQRLQDISEGDAAAEGARLGMIYERETPSYRAGFRDLWESINGDGAWDANPWVVATSFEVARANVASASPSPVSSEGERS